MNSSVFVHGLKAVVADLVAPRLPSSVAPSGVAG